MAVLSDAAAELFAYLPATYGTDRDDVDPIVARWLETLAVEIALLRALLVAIRDTTIPSRADDTTGALGRWEHATGLPVRPVDATVAQRRAQLMAAFRSRRVAHGRDWTAAMDAAIGSPWTVREHTPGPNQLTIEIPYAQGSYSAAQVEALARRRTPANQQIVMRYEQGFRVGGSRVGDAI